MFNADVPRERHIKVVDGNGEADGILLALAVQERAAIVSTDGDFLLTEGHGGWIPKFNLLENCVKFEHISPERVQ